MVPPVAELGPATQSLDERYPWLTPERLTRLRTILLALTLFFGLAVYVFHTLGSSHSASSTSTSTADEHMDADDGAKVEGVSTV